MPIELRVQGLAPEDTGRGIARLGQQSRDELGVQPGDVVQITGRRRTVATVRPAYETDPEDVLRIDGITRANADVEIDDYVEVTEVDSEEATSITVALPERIILRGAEPYLKRHLLNRPVVRGDTIHLRLLGQPFVFIVTKTTPTGPVLVTEQTTLEVRDQPITEEDLEGERSELPDVTYEDVGGLKRELGLIREMIELPMRHPELFRRLGIAPPKGVLLHGPPGTGKTLIAKAVANEIDASFFSLSGPEIMSRYYGESEEQLREIFDEAQEDAPAIVFIDELDSIAPSRDEVTGETERRVVAQLLSLMDGLEARGDVIVIGATNRINAIDPALRRGGRFDREIEIGAPDRDGRLEILQIHTRDMPTADDVDLEGYADRTYGFVGADIESFAKEAAMHALRRVQEEIDIETDHIEPDVLEEIEVTRDDFEAALQNVEPSAMREVFVEVPDVTYEDVGGLKSVQHELVRSVEWPLSYPQMFEKIRTEAPRGILLYGPPGTGKTLLARAVANASNVNFISVKGPELLNKYVGESERGVREVFQRARQNAPTIIFFDEVDAIAPERGESFDSQVTERVVSQLLTELDGIEELRGVFVLGATNRPDIIDRALLRPGRLEKNVYVPIPDIEARREIFGVHTREMPLGDDVDLDALAEDTEGYTGGDIEGIVREASMLALDEVVSRVERDGIESSEELDEAADAVVIEAAHFEEAVRKVKPSVTEEMHEFYEGLVDDLGGESSDEQASPAGFQ
ncbi:CDC48 family AAA ATPase [Halomarina pelagica]|uniref:CDC48 family AAA ATPase n=1 Tax=Halomarina pelagica TaxID=2961599 RepID=UPI0020C1F76E|nr:CDC48 family AAA ATPase [Halomarina sp. BND7]